VGTSVTHRSPSNLPWNAVRIGYERAEVPEDRVLRDIWRAAQADAETDWRVLISSPVVASCLRVVTQSDSAGAALAAATRAIGGSERTFASEVAKRAVVTSFGSDDPRREFVGRLFAAATDYLVSRDLSGHVGLGTRNATVREAAAFKDRLKTRALDSARELAGPAPSAESWPRLARHIVSSLADR
jgi:hypothetical protein